MAIRSELIEELLAEKDPQGVFAPDGLLDGLKKALAERILNALLSSGLPGIGASPARRHRCDLRDRSAGGDGVPR